MICLPFQLCAINMSNMNNFFFNLIHNDYTFFFLNFYTLHLQYHKFLWRKFRENADNLFVT